MKGSESDVLDYVSHRVVNGIIKKDDAATKKKKHDRTASGGSIVEMLSAALHDPASAIITHVGAKESSVSLSAMLEAIQEDRELKSEYGDEEILQPTIADEEMESTPLFTSIATYLGYFVLMVIGHLRDAFGKIFKPQEFANLREQNGYAPLVSDFESFYSRRLFYRIRDCWNRPVTGVPGAKITVLERHSPDYNKTFQLTGRGVECDNLASYNYLGFAEKEGECADAVMKCLNEQPVELDSTRAELGTLPIHQDLEQAVAKYVGKEAAMVFGMGFSTNSTMIPSLVSKGCLILSDELNHTSLVVGCRLSGAQIRTFKHNDPVVLEQVLREAISQGQPRTHRPWLKILVVVEGLYSMEGTICRLPALVYLKRKYKFYLFIDEAHSIGALGPRGRGVCDFWGVDPSEVDILMGTFTKSFGAAGGYIAGDKSLIDWFRRQGHGYLYCEPMAPSICQQTLSSLTQIARAGGEGQRRLTAIRENSIFFMRRLREMGFIVYGDEGSPIVPMLIFNPAKIAAFSREALKLGMAVVVVGYPATPIITSRVRFCISAAHTREQLERVLERVSYIGDMLMMKVSNRKAIAPLLKSKED